jgi:hypothetical protein
MNQRVLTVGIYDEYTLALFVESRSEMHGNRAFTDPALLLSYRDDFRCQFFYSLIEGW